MAKYIKLGGGKSNVGYCRYHKATLTSNQLKHKECLKKQCLYLEKYEHTFWKQREKKKEQKKEKKMNAKQKEIIEANYKNGMDEKQIYEITGIPKAQITKCLVDLGLRRKARRIELTDEIAKLIYNDYKDGMRLLEIQEKYGCGNGTIYRALEKVKNLQQEVKEETININDVRKLIADELAKQKKEEILLSLLALGYKQDEKNNFILRDAIGNSLKRYCFNDNKVNIQLYNKDIAQWSKPLFIPYNEIEALYSTIKSKGWKSELNG